MIPIGSPEVSEDTSVAVLLGLFVGQHACTVLQAKVSENKIADKLSTFSFLLH